MDRRVRLGKREIDALACPPSRQDMLVMDGELTGFAVRVSAGGSKVFLFQYRHAGRVRRLRLGAYGDLTPVQARKLAEEARGRVAAGGDPVGEREAREAEAVQQRQDRKRQQAADALTFRALVRDWGERGLRERSSGYRHEATRCLVASLADLLDEPAHQFDGDRLQAALDAIAEAHPTTARRVRAYGRAAFGWAIKRRLVSANPFVAVAVEGREASRDRVLTDAELGEAWRAAGGIGQPFGPFLRLLILTLQRRGELAGMRWDELAPDRSTWTVPATRAKNRKAHLVHLAPAAREILDAIVPVPDWGMGKPSPLVFTTNGRTPVSGFQNAREQLDGLIAKERAGTAPEGPPVAGKVVGRAKVPAGADWRLHDMRRTGVTVLARLGVAPHVADRLLNHVQGTIRGVAAVYQRHEFMAEREAASRLWADHVLAAAAPAGKRAVAGGNVVQLRSRRDPEQSR